MKSIRSDQVLDVAAVARRHVAAVTFVVTCRFPLQIELIHFFGIFGPDKLGDELELLPKFEDGLLEDGYLARSPPLEHRTRSHWVYQDIQIAFLVQVVDRI